MPSQQVEIAEAIAGIKRALKREREVPSDQPAIAASNRGNKLKEGAKYIHEGSLTYANGAEVYKEKIEHAGYTRYILDRNPRRYNEYGEELEDSETDDEADADAADQNAYSGIRFEELLCPLKHPSELPIHPTMSHAYLSSAIPDMVLSTHEKLRHERANLWRAKYLNRQLTGDASWIPAGDAESPDDWELFEPRSKGAWKQLSRKRKRRREECESQNGHLNQPLEGRYERDDARNKNAKLKPDNLAAQTNGADPVENVERNKVATGGHIAKSDAVNGRDFADRAEQGAPKPANVDFGDAVTEETVGVPEEVKLNGGDAASIEQNIMDKDVRHQADSPDEQIEVGVHLKPRAEKGEKAEGQASQAASIEDDGSPSRPPRRITRALAANNNSNSHSNAPTTPSSPASSSASSSSSSQLQIDPLYLVPQSANPSNLATTFHGLLPEEALETRRLLTLYIQKQEESVRGYEAILSKLLTAQRLRSEVLEMCKTEEHVGELSDGEDWIDAEKWGLQLGELRKGRDEDDDAMEENTIGGRKGKRRARN